MANRRFTQFFYTPHMMPVLLDLNVAIGGSGAVGTVKGPGISSVTRLAAGIYKIKLQDNYNRYYGIESSFLGPVTGSDVPAGSLVTGTLYVITALGTTTQAQWEAAGVPAGVTAAVGVSFVAVATTSGTGTAKAVGSSGVNAVEVAGQPTLQLGPQGVANQGGYIIIKCIGVTSSSDTTPIAVDPASGSTLFLQIYLSNSSVQVQGE